MLLDRLWQDSRAVAIAPPASVKLYAAGKGNASKDQVLTAAVRRLPGFDGDNNEADAAWMAAMGLDHLTGHSVVPASQRQALAKLKWPTVAVAS
jgi:Holliday junction resolvasome RuvABC endonuclease subunit